MKRSVRRIAAFALAGMMSISMVAPVSDNADAASLKLNKKNISLKVGQTFKLQVKGKKVSKVKWSSSKKKVATVNKKGVVKAAAPGNAVITAKVKAKKLTCKVKISKMKNDVKASEIPAATEQVAIPTAQTTVLPATAAPVQTAPVATSTPGPTDTPEPTPTPEYMQEGAFVYDKLDISWIDPDKPMIAFTFDDGPVGDKDTDYSMRIQKVLKEYGCHATFNYITGIINSDSKRNEILQSMENGNEIANHTSDYKSLTEYDGGNGAGDEIEKARAALEELTGITNFTLRPPNLALNDNVKNTSEVPLIGCNIISNDWENATTKEHIVEVTKGAKDGDIVLFHETMQHTAEAVEELVPYFIEEGYQIVSVVELFAAKDIPLFAGNYYNKAEYQPPRD